MIKKICVPNLPDFSDMIQEQTYVFIWPCKDFLVSNATEGSQQFFQKTSPRHHTQSIEESNSKTWQETFSVHTNLNCPNRMYHDVPQLERKTCSA